MASSVRRSTLYYSNRHHLNCTNHCSSRPTMTYRSRHLPPRQRIFYCAPQRVPALHSPTNCDCQGDGVAWQRLLLRLRARRCARRAPHHRAVVNVSANGNASVRATTKIAIGARRDLVVWRVQTRYHFVTAAADWALWLCCACYLCVALGSALSGAPHLYMAAVACHARHCLRLTYC